jgi:pyruvate formate lyase activating enzyme
MPKESKGLVFDIKRDCSGDGPGIRTTIFFKGCPLSCVWCQNPEGISPKPSISFSSERCDPTACGGYACIEVCPSKLDAIKPEENKIQLDHDACNRCDRCFEVCTPQALEPVGNWWTTKNLVDKVLIDRNYFESTGGGVTVSGGEPTAQLAFLHQFLAALKQEGINTGLQTSGMFQLDQFQSLILPSLDFIYFDLKLIDPAESRRFTGRSNAQIIKNFTFLNDKAAVPIIPRVPLIPDITANKKNLSGISEFLKKHGVKACELMPYNPLWIDKAANSGVHTNYSRSEFMSPEEEKMCVQWF